MATDMSLPIGRLLDSESWTWFYSRLKSKSNNFSSAKAFENIYKRRTSDSENDSGYAPSSDFRLKLSQIPSSSRQPIFNMADSASHEDCDDDEEEEEEIGEEEEAAEIHHSIETIVEGLLGSPLDDASVDRIYYYSPEYEKLFTAYHSQLVEAIRNLSHSLRRALHGIPHENEITPTAAHATLKCLVTALVEDCQELPYLQASVVNEEEPSVENMTLIDIDIFCSYEGLVASAIINKVVEELQSRFVRQENSFLHVINDRKADEIHTLDNKTCSCEKVKDSSSDDCELITESFSVTELPLECVQIEEVEEITREYTDSDDDKFSNISHQSSGLQSIDELGMQRCGSEVDLFYTVQPECNVKIPFPEFGSDLVHNLVGAEDSTSCYSNTISTWEENWLFKKKKKLPFHGSIRYQLLTYYDEPPCMLIPCPSENSCTIETDELSSELSESHSVGSFELFSDSEKSVDGNSENTEFPSVLTTGIDRSIDATTSLPVLNKCGKDLHQEANAPTPVPSTSLVSKTVPLSESSKDVTENILNLHLNSSEHELQSDFIDIGVSDVSSESFVPVPHEGKPAGLITRNTENCERKNHEVCNAAGDIFLIPTHPGTIAEREHKKWMNAVPLENNPYSAENISRRCCNIHARRFPEHVSSFEEFEHTLTDFPHCTIKKPLQTKLYCGLKSIDGSLYKRDYYVNNSQNGHEKNHHYKSVPNFENYSCENYGTVPEETLNSLEEKVYISAGKVFTLENHVKRLEREVKDISLSGDGSFFPATDQYYSEKMMKNIASDHLSSDNDDNMALPSVKVLATKFNSSSGEKQENVFHDIIPEKTDEDTKVKKARPCVKVHSLTARSLSREFRDRAKQNLPKPMNRFSVPPQVSDDAASEQESICSPVSALQSDITHGYTSDESSTSTSSIPRSKALRHISRSILQRASYWERRVEQGLLSDASVNEEFPGLEVSPNS